MDNNPKPHEDVKPEEEKKDEFSYTELHKEDIKDIASNKELPEEGKEEQKKPEEEKKPEETPEVKPEAEKKEEPKKPEEEETVIDPKQMVEEISQKVTEKLSPKEAEEEKDKYTQFFEKVQKEKGRAPNWRELSEFLEEQAVLRVQKQRDEEVEKQKKAEEEKRKADEELARRFNDQVDEELEELYKTGALTPIKDKNNPSDPGVLERKALFQAMLDTNKQRATEGKPAILSIERIYYGGYYKKPTVQPAGADAPISAGQGTPAASPDDEKEIDYIKDVRKPWSFFKRV